MYTANCLISSIKTSISMLMENGTWYSVNIGVSKIDSSLDIICSNDG